MLRHKRIDTICIVVCCLAVILTLLFMNGESWGLQTAADRARYS